MDNDINDIFRRFDEIFSRLMSDSGNAGFRDAIVPWSDQRTYRRDRGMIHSTSVRHREEIFSYDDCVIIVLELPALTEDDIDAEVIEHDGKRVLRFRTGDGWLSRMYALSDDMTGEVDFSVRNGVLEVRLDRRQEVVDIGGENHD